MRKVIQVAVLAAIFAAILPIAAQQFGKQIAEQQAERQAEEFQQQLDASVKSGDVEIVYDETGRKVYRNTSLRNQ